MWNFKETLVACVFLYYFFPCNPRNKFKSTKVGKYQVSCCFKLTRYPSFDCTQRKPSVGLCDFNDIYEPVKRSSMMRLIDLMAPEMTSIKHKRPIIPARRQMPPSRSTSPRLERSVSRKRFKEFFPVLLSLIHTADVKRLVQWVDGLNSTWNSGPRKFGTRHTVL